MIDLRSKDLAAAVARIDFRAERRDLFLELYEDTGVLGSLAANTHQIIQGRRGSGKTHLLGSFEDRINREFSDFVAVRIDLRDCANFPQELETRHKVFWAFWLTMHYAVGSLRANIDLLRSLNPQRFSPADFGAAQSLLQSVQQRIKKSELDTTFIGRFSKASTKIEGFIIQPGIESDHETIESVFENICRLLKLKYIVILLDEWSSLQPLEIQPLVAEVFKKSILTSKQLALKIATIRYRSLFETVSPQDRLGLELGADIVADIDLDMEVIWEREADRAVAFFSSLLRKHLRHVITQSGMNEEQLLAQNGNWTVQWFASNEALLELVRAGEGIPRDFLNIFKRSFASFLQDSERKPERISIRHIRSSAASWFEEDKRPAAQVDNASYKLFEELLDEFVAKKKTKHFLIRQSDVIDEGVQRLVDNRLLHRIRRGWSSRHHPGIRYDVFSIDYGAFVNSMDTNIGKTIRLAFEPDDDSDAPLETVDLRNIRHQLFTPKTKTGAN